MRSPVLALATLAGLAAFALTAGPACAQAPGGAAKPAAVVNGEPIALADVEALIKAGVGPAAVEVPEGKRREMRREALGALIDQLLLQQFLRQYGPRIDPVEASKKLAELEAELKKQNKTLADFLKDSGQTEAQLRAHLITMLQWRDYGKARLSEVDVRKYYDEYKDFFDGVTVRASHIVLRVSPGASDVEVQAARTKLLQIRQEIESKKIDFAEAAKKYSQCPSAPGGGDIGYFPRLWAVDEAFARAAFNPALKVGDVTGVVQSEYGLHLIKVTDRKAGQPSDYAKIKDDVREFCTEDLRQRLLADLRKKARIEVNLP